MNDVIALYPTARKVEDWLMRHSRGRSLLDYPIMTFPQLIDRLWREFGPRGVMLDELQERLAAEEAIGDARDEIRLGRAEVTMQYSNFLWVVGTGFGFSHLSGGETRPLVPLGMEGWYRADAGWILGIAFEQVLQLDSIAEAKRGLSVSGPRLSLLVAWQWDFADPSP